MFAPHFHICGNLDGQHTGGCGHVWWHNPRDIEAQDNEQHHICPACGAGPWYLQYSQRSCAIKAIPFYVPVSAMEEMRKGGYTAELQQREQDVEQRASTLLRLLVALAPEGVTREY